MPRTPKRSKKKTAAVRRLPTRDKVAQRDCWDLSSLFTSDAAWERAFAWGSLVVFTGLGVILIFARVLKIPLFGA